MNAVFSNPIIGYYKGVSLRKYNMISIRLDIEDFKKFIDLEQSTGFGRKKILALSGQPCNCCVGTLVKGVPRGLLSKKTPTNG